MRVTLRTDQGDIIKFNTTYHYPRSQWVPSGRYTRDGKPMWTSRPVTLRGWKDRRRRERTL